MSGHVEADGINQKILSSLDLATSIGSSDFSDRSALVVGYGNMGREYVKALQRLRVRKIRVCSRSAESLAELQNARGIEVYEGGYQRLDLKPDVNELAIVATPTAELEHAAAQLITCGYRRILIEKPVSLRSDRIEALTEKLKSHSIDACCAYNRVAYPSFHEVRARVQGEGGITSCTYTFTEFVHRIGPGHFSMDELRRWGIANSLHVMSMAHGLIGLPETWSGHHSGSISWHPSGSVFVGSGISSNGIPFAYHADWGSTGRWSVEVHTRHSSYRLCPLESLFRRTSATGAWEQLPLTITAPDIKAGFVEQVAAMLMERPVRIIAMPPLREVASLTKYAEDVFGYRS